MADEEVPSYIARCPKCQKLVMAAVDVPEMARENAKEIANLVRKGYIIERTTVGWVRQNFELCDCNVLKSGKKNPRVTQPGLM